MPPVKGRISTSLKYYGLIDMQTFIKLQNVTMMKMEKNLTTNWLWIITLEIYTSIHEKNIESKIPFSYNLLRKRNVKYSTIYKEHKIC